ncbi:hypothetical protein [Olivibacter domesticus]|uniref:Uncharacterized protein n=1 Tax=Olivibacter domesticus TaxID=407022 RepID=A0A1H7RW31_OLID1|nr:hypothetical protein [Olivibacter domesticus]SEL64375.1 hypothetical protein SAMN05661044_02966 [Olivibacter domesticus]
MKNFNLFICLVFFILTCPTANANNIGKISKQEDLVSIRGNNSTSVNVNVFLRNAVTGQSYSFVVPANSSNVVLGELPKSNDYYDINMWSSTAVRMRFYWADSITATTGLIAEDVPVASCDSCPTIYIGN